MLKKILVCLEGSLSSEAATRMSIAIARTCGARLSGLAIIDEPDIRAGAVTGIGGASFKHSRDESLMADAHKHAADWVALFEKRCRDGGVPGQGIEVVGRPVDSIVRETAAHDLVVIGKDANFRFETETNDVRTREAILHRATGPVLLVPESAAPTIGSVVVLAYDGSGAAKRALKSFAESGLASTREIHVATVDDSGAHGWEMADRGVRLLAEFGIPAKLHNVVSVLSNVDALNELATKLGAGLMVMGAFAHGGLRNLIFSGSVTHVLLEKSAIPLYLQH
jgi:nucleotide-binding universal stress UspA family protein